MSNILKTILKVLATPVLLPLHAFKYNQILKQRYEEIKKDLDEKNKINLEEINVLTIGPAGNGKSRFLNKLFKLNLIESSRIDSHGTLSADIMENKTRLTFKSQVINVYDTRGLAGWKDEKLLNSYIKQVFENKII